jgi:hypothetical protein
MEADGLSGAFPRQGRRRGARLEEFIFLSLLIAWESVQGWVLAARSLEERQGGLDMTHPSSMDHDPLQKTYRKSYRSMVISRTMIDLHRCRSASAGG